MASKNPFHLRFRWFQPPWRTLLLYSGFTFILFVVLSIQGIQLIKRNHQLAIQQISDNLRTDLQQIDADLTVHIANRVNEITELANVESDEYSRYFSEHPEAAGDSMLFVALGEDWLFSNPEDLLIYPPFVTTTHSTIDMAFAEAQLREHRDSEIQDALDLYRTGMADPDPHLSALATFHVGRCLRRLGRNDEAIQTYTQLLNRDDLLLEGEPVSLRSMSALCQIYRENDQFQLLSETQEEIRQGLLSHRWTIDFFSYNEYCNGIPGTDVSGKLLAYSAACDSLWHTWYGQSRMVRQPDWNHALASFNGHHLFISSRSDSTRVLACLTDLHSLSAASPLLTAIISAEDFSFTIRNLEGLVIFSSQPFTSEFTETLPPGESQLPFALTLAQQDTPGLFAEVNQRVRLLAVVLAVTLIVIVVAGVQLTRAVLKEINLARLQSDFVSAVSHEFRSPLTSIRQLSELIADDRVADELQRDEYFNVISGESMRLHRLVEELLDFRRMEAGAKEFHMRPLDIKAMVHETVDLFEADVIGRRAPISREYEVEDVPVYGDREMLARALWNLLDNAVRYSPGNPSVAVTVRSDDHRILISITDQGLGIPAEEQKQIFNKFVRGQAAQKTIAKGSGIGLSIVRQIIDAHEGKISVKSEPGKGSTFTISLPIWTS
ncbi:ATP-binding protein [Gemmatimonadota bacterium]